MTDDKPMSCITLVVSYLISKQVLNILEEMAVPLVFWQYARRDLLNFNTFFAKIFGRPRFENERMEQFIIYVPHHMEYAVSQKLIHDLDLTIPGRGSLYCQNVRCHSRKDLIFEEDRFPKEISARTNDAAMHGITLIIGRGLADHIAYQTLEKGYAPPAVIFGEGMGTREKLGLVRVTIPPEKEIMYAAAYYQDLPMLLALLRHAAHLNLPGKGLLYHYPLTFAKIDTKTQTNLAFHMASRDQIISAIDTLMNNTQWRRKNQSRILQTSQENPPLGRSAVCLNVFVPYGLEDNTTKIAFNLGVSGATKKYYRSLRYKNGSLRPDKDYSAYTMVMNENLLNPVLKSLQKEPSSQETRLDSYSITVS